MKYVAQFTVIIFISFIGEILNRLIPLPVPASIYGFVILFLCLELKVIKLHQVKDVGSFLLAVMPVTLVPPSVGFMAAFPIMKQYGLQFIAIALITTFGVMVVTGHVAQFVVRRKRKEVSRKEKKLQDKV